MKKTLALLAMILLSLTVIVLSGFKTVLVFPFDSYLVQDNAPARNLRTDIGKEAQTLPLVSVNSSDFLYSRTGKYYVGEGKKTAVNIKYPVYLNGGTALMTLSDSFSVIDADFYHTASFRGMVVSDGHLFNLELDAVDEDQYILMRTPDDVYLNLSTAVVKTAMHEYYIPLNSMLSFEEHAIRFYSMLDNGELEYGIAPDVDYASVITIGDMRLSYYDFLDMLGKIQQITPMPTVPVKPTEPKVESDTTSPTEAAEEDVQPETVPPQSSGDHTGTEGSTPTKPTTPPENEGKEDGSDDSEGSGGDTGDQGDKDGDEEEAGGGNDGHSSNPNKGDRPAKPQPGGGIGSGSGDHGSTGSGNTGGSGDFPVNPMDPSISCSEFTPGVYQITSKLTIFDPTAALHKGVRFEVYMGSELKARKTFYTSADPAIIGGLIPGQTYTVKGTYIYDHAIKDASGKVIGMETLTKEFVNQEITLLGLENLPPLQLHMDQGSYAPNCANLQDVHFTAESLETAGGVQRIVLQFRSGLTTAEYSVLGMNLQNLQSGTAISNLRTSQNLTANKKWAITYECYDLYGSKLPVDSAPITGSVVVDGTAITLTTKNLPNYSLRLGKVAPGSVQMTLTQLSDRDNLGTKNLRVVVYETKTGKALQSKTNLTLHDKTAELEFAELPEKTTCYAVAYCDGVLRDGWPEEQVELTRIVFTTDPISAMGEVYLNSTVQLDEEDSAKVGLHLRMMNNTGTILRNFLSSVTLNIVDDATGQTVKSFPFTSQKDENGFEQNEDFAKLLAGESFDLQVLGLKGVTTYRVEATSYISYGGEQIAIKSNVSTKEFTTYKTMAIAYAEDIFTNGNYITFNACVLDAEDVIVGDTVYVRVRQRSGARRMVYNQPLQVASSLQEMTYIPFEVTENIEPGMDYIIEFYADEYNRGSTNATRRSGVFATKSLENVRIAQGNIYLLGTLLAEDGFVGEVNYSIQRSASGNTAADSMHYFIELLEGPDADHLTEVESQRVNGTVSVGDPIKDAKESFNLKANRYYEIRLYADIPGHTLMLSSVSFVTDTIIQQVAGPVDLKKAMFSGDGKYVVTSDITAPDSMCWDTLTAMDMEYQNIMYRDEDKSFEFNGIGSAISAGKFSKNIDLQNGWELEMKFKLDKVTGYQYLWDTRANYTGNTSVTLRTNTTKLEFFYQRNGSTQSLVTLMTGLEKDKIYEVRLVQDSGKTSNLKFYLRDESGKWVYKNAFTVKPIQRDDDWRYNTIGGYASVATTSTGVTHAYTNYFLDGKVYRAKFATNAGTLVDLDPSRDPDTMKAVELDRFENMAVGEDSAGNHYFIFDSAKKAYIELPWMSGDIFANGFCLEFDAQWKTRPYCAPIFFAMGNGNYNVGRVSIQTNGTADQLLGQFIDTAGTVSITTGNLGLANRQKYQFIYRVAPDSTHMNGEIKRWKNNAWSMDKWWKNVPQSYVKDVDRNTAYIGRSYYNGSYPENYFNGNIHSVRIYSGANEPRQLLFSMEADGINTVLGKPVWELIGMANDAHNARTLKRENNNKLLDTPFTGSVDFQGFSVTKNSPGSFMPLISEGGEIRNAVFHTSGSVNYATSLSPVLVGRNEGTISDIIVHHSGTQHYANANVGAITLENRGVLEKFAIVMHSTVYGEKAIGMAAVRNSGVVRNGYVVTEPTSSMVYAIDASDPEVTAKLDASQKSVGGLVGYNQDTGSVENVYSTISVLGYKNQYTGLVVGYTEGRVASGYGSGTVDPVTGAYGPAIAGLGGNAAAYPNYAGLYYVEIGGKVTQYNNRFNYPATTAALAELNWQRDRLGRGSFDIDDYVKMNYYPHVQMSGCMPDQPLVPITKVSPQITVTGAEVQYYYNEDMSNHEQYGKQAYVKFKVYNPGLSKPTITDIKIPFLSVGVDTELQENPLGDYSYVYAHVKVDPAGSERTHFGQYQDQYTVNSITVASGLTVYANNVIDLPFWKPVNCVSGDSNGDGDPDGWCDTVVKFPDQNYVITADLDFAGVSVMDFQVSGAFAGDIIGCMGGERPTLRNMNLGGEANLFSYESETAGSVGYIARLMNLDFENITLGGLSAENTALVKQLSGLMDGVSIRSSTAGGYKHVSLLVGECQPLGIIRNCSTSDCTITYHDTPWFTGEHSVGGITALALAQSTIEHCFVQGQSIVLHDCYSSAGAVGGLVGMSYGSTVVNCYAEGSIEAFSDNVGGAIGAVRVPTDSESELSGNITNLYSKMQISAKGSRVGGLIGYLQGGVSGLRGLVLGDMSNALPSAAGVHAGIGEMTESASAVVYGVDSMFFNGVPCDSTEGFGDGITWLTEDELRSSGVYANIGMLSGFAAPSQDNVLPKLRFIGAEGILPYQPNIRAVDTRLVKIRSVNRGMGSSIDSPVLVFDVEHEPGMNLTGLTFEGGHLVTYTPAVDPITATRTMITYRVNVEQSRAMDDFRIITAQYTEDGKPGTETTKCVWNVNIPSLFNGQHLFKIIYNSDMWYTYMTENMNSKLYQNYRVAEGVTISMADRINVPHNLYIGHLEGMGSGAVISDIFLDLSGGGAGESLILKERGSISNLTFHNISVIAKTSTLSLPSDYGCAAGIIGTSYGTLKNLVFDHIAVTSSNGSGFVAAVGHKADGDMINCYATNSYINYDKVVVDGQVRVEDPAKNQHAQTAASSGRCGTLVGLWSSLGELRLSGTEDSPVEIENLYVVGGKGTTTGTTGTYNYVRTATGGLVGSMFFRPATVEYVNFNHIYVKTSGPQAGGVFGNVGGRDTANTTLSKLSHISLKDVTVSGVGTRAAGLAAQGEDIGVDHIELDGATITASGDYVGGLMGYTYAKVPLPFTDIKISDVKITNTGTNYTGGAVGQINSASTTNRYTIENVEASKITVTGRHFTAAIFGASNNGKVSNVTLQDFDVTATGYNYIGGVVGYAPSAPVTNVTVSRGDARETKNTVKGTYYVGGVCGYVNAASGNLEVSDTAVTAATQYAGACGGQFVGNVKTENVTVANCEVTANYASGYCYAGGAFGLCYQTVTNLTVTDTKVTGKGGYVGGAIGQHYSSGSVTNVKVYSTTEEPVVITGSGYVGGITGQSNRAITNGVAHDLRVVGVINDKAYGAVGGAVGSAASAGALTNIYVYDVVVDSTNVSTGGLAGECNTKAYNNVVRDCTVQSTKNNVGGLIGNRTAPSSGNDLYNNTVSRVKLICPNSDYVGGLAGQLCGNARTNSVYNVDIQGHSYVGGLVGFLAEYTGETANTTYNLTKSYINNRDGVSKITATGENVGGLVGRISRNGVVDSCYAHTDVEGASAVGGLAGFFANTDVTVKRTTYDENGMPVTHTETLSALSKLENCYYDGNIKGGSGVGGVLGVIAACFPKDSQDFIRPKNNLIAGVTITASGVSDFNIGALKEESGFVKYPLLENKLDVQNVERLRDENVSVYNGASLNGLQASAENAFPKLNGTEAVITVLTREQLQDPQTYTGVFAGTNFRTDKLGDNIMPYLAAASFVMVEGEDGIFSPVEETGYMPYVAVPNTEIAPPPAPMMMSKSARKQLTVYAYPSGINTVTVQIPSAAAGEHLSIYSGDGKEIADTLLTGNIVSFIYDYADNLTIRTEQGSALVYLDNIARRVMVAGNHGYFITDAGVCDETGAVVAPGDYVHLYQGMAMSTDGRAVSLDGSMPAYTGENGRVLASAVGAVRCSDGADRYDIFTDRTVITHSNGTTSTLSGTRCYYKGGVPYFIKATDARIPVDSVFCFSDGTNAYQTVVMGSTLADVKQPSLLLTDELVRTNGVSYIAQNLSANAPYLLLAYSDGSLAGYNYLTGEELFYEPGPGMGLWEYLVSGFSLFTDSDGDNFAMNQKLAKSYAMATGAASFLNSNSDKVAQILEGEKGGASAMKAPLDSAEELNEALDAWASGNNASVVYDGDHVAGEPAQIEAAADDGVRAESGLTPAGMQVEAEDEQEKSAEDSEQTDADETDAAEADVPTDTASGLSLGRPRVSKPSYIPVFNADKEKFEIYSEKELRAGISKEPVEEELERSGVYLPTLIAQTVEDAQPRKSDGIVIFAVLSLVVFSCGLAFAGYRTKRRSDTEQ